MTGRAEEPLVAWFVAGCAVVMTGTMAVVMACGSLGDLRWPGPGAWPWVDGGRGRLGLLRRQLGRVRDSWRGLRMGRCSNSSLLRIRFSSSVSMGLAAGRQ